MGVVVRRPSLYGHWRDRGARTGNVGTRTISIGLVEGQDVTCTFINTLQTGTLTVIKHVINNDGGSASASNWSIHVQQSGSEVTGSPQAGAESPGTSYTLPGGSYTVSETGTPTTYAFQGFSGDCNSSGVVTVVAGATKTCTLTNTDNTPSLKLVKVVTNNDGGTAVANDWDLSAATAAVGFTDRNFTELTPAAADATAQNVYAGKAYTLTEAPNPGTGYSTTGEWSCTTGGTLDATNTIVTVALGAHVTCTITNTDNTPSLKLVKVVTNNDGGTAVANDWDRARRPPPSASPIATSPSSPRRPPTRPPRTSTPARHTP